MKNQNFIFKTIVIALGIACTSTVANAQWNRNAVNQATYLSNTGDNVGIGTTNPQFKLDIQSTSAASMSFKSTTSNSNIIIDRANSASTSGVNYRTNGVPFWQTGTIGTDNYVIRNVTLGTPALSCNYLTNNVGIGTTVPVARLHVVGDGRIQGNLHVTNNSSFGASMNVSGDVTANNFYTSGNAGIGNTSPDCKLHVTGGTDASVSGGGFIQAGSTSGTNIVIDNNEILARDGGLASTLYVNGGGNVRMCNNAVGNLGVGPIVPTQRLHVSGNILVEDGDIYLGPSNGTINAGGGLMDALVNIIADVDNHALVLGDEDLYIEGELEVGNQAYKPGGGNWTTISDARLKKDVKSYNDGLEQLMKINPVTFKYNDKVKFLNPDKEYVGIIAQEMQKVAPYMVEEKALFSKSHEGEDGNVIVDDPGQNYLTYDGSALTYMLVNAVKEQQQQIEELKTALNSSGVNNSEQFSKASDNNLQQSENKLFQNQPNPFNQSTVIRYQLSADVNALIIIRDLSGNLVKQVSIAKSSKGQVTINANELAQGTYTYTLEVNGVSMDTKLMVVTK